MYLFLGEVIDWGYGPELYLSNEWKPEKIDGRTCLKRQHYDNPIDSLQGMFYSAGGWNRGKGIAKYSNIHARIHSIDHNPLTWKGRIYQADYFC